MKREKKSVTAQAVGRSGRTGCSAWGILWRSDNRLDGKCEHLVIRHGPYDLFQTRKDCRDFIEKEYGWIRARDDLRREPHGWKMPKAVRVFITPNPGGLGTAARKAP